MTTFDPNKLPDSIGIYTSHDMIVYVILAFVAGLILGLVI
jgi:hypothetical protein